MDFQVQIISAPFLNGKWAFPPLNIKAEIFSNTIDNRFSAWYNKYPADGIETVIGTYLPNENRYQFANMAGYLETLMSNADADLQQENDFFVLPVSGVTEVAGTKVVVRHLFKPFAVRLRSEGNQKSPMRLAITYSNL